MKNNFEKSNTRLTTGSPKGGAHKCLRCDWLEVCVSFELYKHLVRFYIHGYGFGSKAGDFSWLEHFTPSIPEVDRTWAIRHALTEVYPSGDYFGGQRLMEKACNIHTEQISALKEGRVSEYNKKWYRNGRHLLSFQESKKEGFVHITASGQAGHILLAELREYTEEFLSDNLQFIRLDLKKQMPFSSSHRTLNWDRIYKRQLEAENLKSQYSRKVQLMKSETGTTLAIGTRGCKSYCRLEYINASNKLNASNEPLISFELEYRKKQAKKVGHILVKNGKRNGAFLAFEPILEKDEKHIAKILKDYLLTLEPIQNITHKLLKELSVSDCD